MTEKKISRRDAMKILGVAVGAAALSTLPSKWNTPELVAGVLPAHARQSGGPIGPICAGPIVRTSFGVFANPGASLVGALTANITDANFDGCAFTQMTFAWEGNPVPAGGTNVQVTLVGGVGDALGSLILPPGTTSPFVSVDTNCWTGLRPYNGLRITNSTLASWMTSTITITIS